MSSTYKVDNIESTSAFEDSNDPTKKINFDLTNITTGNTRNVVVPDNNFTLAGTTIIQVLTNKTIDADLNTFSNIDNNDIKTSAGIDATKIADGSVNNTKFQYINNLSSEAAGISDAQILTNKTLTDSSTYFQDNADNSKKIQLELSNITTSTTRTLTIPDANTTLVGTNVAQTLTNKTLDNDLNTITNVDNAAIKANANIDASKLADGSVSNTKFQYINGLTSNVQTQINDHTSDTNNPHLVTKGQIGLSNVENLKVNLTATSDPGLTDDSNSNYVIGSRWINVNRDVEFVCLDASIGAAVWKNVTQPNEFDATVDLNGAGDYTTVYDALNAGHKTIFVKKGIYTETNDLILPDKATLIGESASETIINLSGTISVRCDGNGGTDETAGTITYTTDSTIVTGIGTAFTNLSVGDFILLSHNFYEIASIESNTSLTLSKTFRGASGINQTYIGQSMKTGILIRNFIIANSTGTGLYLRAIRHSILNNVAVRSCALNMEILQSGSNNFIGFVSHDSGTNGIVFTNNFSNSIYACEVYNSDNHGVLFNGTTNAIIINGLLSSNNDGNGLNFMGTASHINVLDSICVNNDGKGINAEATTRSIIVNNCTLSDNGIDGIDFNGSNNMVSNCVIKNNGGYGVQGGESGMISNNHIENNGNIGINLDNALKCVVEGNHILNSAGNGIWTNSDYMVITDNYIEASTANGIQIDGGNDNIIGSNVIYNNTGKGIYMTLDCSRCIINGNKIIANTVGIHVTGTSHDCTINDNSITSCSSHGIQIATNTNIITGNRCTANTGDGCVINSGATNNIIQNNNFTGNTGSDFTDNGTVDGNLPGILINELDSRSATILSLGKSTATKIEIGKTAVTTQVKGNLDISEGLDVTGNVAVTGTVDGRDVATDGASLDNHIGNTNNPHTVTAAQVGNITAQWNANKLQGVNIAVTSPQDGCALIYESNTNSYEPKEPFDDKMTSAIFDDFVGASFTNIWIMNENGTGSNVTLIDGVGGQAQLTSGTSTNDYSDISSSKKLTKIGSAFTIRIRIKLDSITDNIVNIGVISDDNNLIDFQYDASDAGANWFARTINAGTATNTDTTVAANTSWHIFEILSSSADVKFFIDGTLRATNTTNLFTGLMKIYAKQTTKTTTSRVLLLDYVKLICDRDGNSEGSGGGGGGGCTLF